CGTRDERWVMGAAATGSGHPARKVDMGRLSCLSGAEPTSMWMEVRHGCSRASRNSCGGFAEAGPHLIDGHRAALPGVAIG
ncbi:hypothetical protein, partial [Mycobacterium tuberculosis]